MPAYIPSLGSAGMKWVSGYPGNQKKGLPYTTGLLILNDPETGMPLAVMDATWITAMRTGAATGIAAKYLARKDSSSVGIVACGVQGRSDLEALCCLFDVQRVRAYDLHPEIAARFAKIMGAQLEEAGARVRRRAQSQHQSRHRPGRHGHGDPAVPAGEGKGAGDGVAALSARANRGPWP